MIFAHVCDSAAISRWLYPSDFVEKSGTAFALTCRQIFTEVAPILDNFTYLFVGEGCLYHLEVLVGRFKCAELLTIELSDYALDKIALGMIMTKTVDSYRDSWETWCDRQAVREAFPAIERLIVPSGKPDGEAQELMKLGKNDFRKWLQVYFGKPNLEVVFL